MYPQDFLFIFHGFLCVLVYGSSISHTRRGLGAGVTQVVDFDCPEEFGYYPHPTDCTQYYVCVFGGALLESCTGGLMYSHELQTCDWPRNVGCSESGGSDGGTISTVRVTDPRTRNPQQSRTSSSPQQQQQQSPAQAQPTRSSHRQDYNRPHQQEVIQQTLYAEEDLGPAEEVETDRQQRVYRGQPSALGQVQRDRDGFRPLKNSVHSQNIIPTGPGTQDKISVVSFGSGRPSAPRPQEQYRHLSTNMAVDDFDSVPNDKTDNVTKKIHSRSKRQIISRTGHFRTNVPQIPYVIFSGPENPFPAHPFINPNPFGQIARTPLVHPFSYNIHNDNKIHMVHPIHEYYQPQNVAAAVHRQYFSKIHNSDNPSNRSHVNEELIRLTKSTIQSDLRPIRYSRPVPEETMVRAHGISLQNTRYLESVINPPGVTKGTIQAKPPPSRAKVKPVTQKPSTDSRNKYFAPSGFIRVTTERSPTRDSTATRPDGSDGYRTWIGPAKTITTRYNVHLTRLHQGTTTERYHRISTTPSYKFVEKPSDYDFRWHDLDSVIKGKGNSTDHFGLSQEHQYVKFSTPPDYRFDQDEEDEVGRPAKQSQRYPDHQKKEEEVVQIIKPEMANRKRVEVTQTEKEPLWKDTSNIQIQKTNMSFFEFIDEAGFRDAEEIKAAFKTRIPRPETTTKRLDMNLNDEEFYVPENNDANIKKRFQAHQRFQPTTLRPKISSNQIESPRKKIPEEYYENFKPFPTKSLYLTRQPDDDDDDDISYERPSVTSLNNLEKKSRVEQVQTHQVTSALPPLSPSPRPIEQHHNTSQRFQPNQFDQYYAVYDEDVDIYRTNDYGHQQYQTPSSTPSSSIAHQYRGQTTLKQQNINVEQTPEQHRNTYSQDLYSPPPVLQDYNDQYNVQIDDQQYQQLGQPTPKSSLRSERTNSSKDALTESTVSVSRVPENVTSKPDSASITRRSDSNSYYSISSFGPSTVLLPPLRFVDSTPKFLDTTFPPPPKTDKPLYPESPKNNLRGSFEPPKNGGALAKTFNSFDSLLSSFLAAVTKPNSRPTPIPSPSTTPPTPVPPKTSPETIVRSEIGRIHHEPLVITENFKIRGPTLRKPETTQVESKSRPVQSNVISSIPSLSPTPTPPPKLSQNDYLAYFVEIEPKKPKQEEGVRGFPLTSTEALETTTEPRIITKDNLGFGKADQIGFNIGIKGRPLNSFVRIVPNSQTQNVRLGATLELEPTGKPQEKKKIGQEPENETIEKQKIIGPITTISHSLNPAGQPVGKWVLAKNERPQQPPRYQTTPNSNPFDVYSQERQKEQANLRGKVEVEEEPIQKEKAQEVEAIPHRSRGNVLFTPHNSVPELETTVVSSPYKFLLVDLDSTTEQLSTPAPFSRNPENEERNRFSYKTNPESRVRFRYFDDDNANSSITDEAKTRTTFAQDPIQVSTEPATSFGVETEDRLKFSYKTNPETRFRSRYLGTTGIVIEDEKEENAEVTPKTTVPETKSEEKPILVLDETPIQVVPQEETKEPELALSKRRKPEPRPITVEPEPSSRKPFRYRTTTESVETETASEEIRKPPRRVVKIYRNDLKNQRLSTLAPKLKRFRKPSTKSPIVVLEDLEEKSLAKENEIHPTYRPIVVSDGLDSVKNKTRFRFTVEDLRDFTLIPDNRIPGGPYSTTEKFIIDAAPRGFEKPSQRPQSVPVESENDVPDREVPSLDKPGFPNLKRPLTLKNVTQVENRATTKAYRGKFKPSENTKLRLRPTTASPDSESTPGPHLSTRQPSGYTIGSTGNEVTINRGTPAPNRGTRPTLKPSTAIVSKASEFIDIYRYPPRRPQNLYATPTPDKSAAKCRKDVCLLPDCNCGGKDIPGGYNAEEIPQLVLLTFDDSVNDLNKGLYAELFERGRVNPNGCPISATFYVSHEWTDYSQVQNLYANGHEIASHSITHSFGEQFSQKKWTKEIAGQREILAAYGGVRLEDIRGMRAPFLAVGGNKMFKMLYDSNFTYDSSMPIYENRPPSWPYTLDYKLFHDCMIPPCPTKSYPGVWEVPMVMWQDLNGGRCSMGDACSNPPTADGVYKMLIKNFERHFTTNRAPFGLYYHAAWFTHEHHKEGFIAFLDTIVNMPEVWLVTSWQAIEWVRDPQPLSTVNNFPPFQCNVEKAKKCNNPKVCNLWHKSGVRYMRTCQPCPDVYPWTGKTGVRNSRVDNEIIDE